VTITPAAGKYTVTQNVTVTTAEQADIFCTLDGSYPTVASPKHTTQFVISKPTVVKCLAKDTVGNIGSVASAQYYFPDGKMPGGSGTVNITDALKALRFAIGVETPTADQLFHLDVAPLDATTHMPLQDGVIDGSDVLLILRKVTGFSW
jgi:hypothetical protein